MAFIHKLLEFVKESDLPLYIQTHNFPDHDAVASAFALQQLFRNQGIDSSLVYEGTIERDSLKKMIDVLGIEIKHISSYSMREEDQIIIVDGCKWNKNVTDLVGDEIGVIDHHRVSHPDDVPFVDIRSDWGSCSTIIFSYYEELKLEIPNEVATALLIGIDMDTQLLTRHVHSHDIHAYALLYQLADTSRVNSVLRNYIQLKDLNFYKEAIERLKLHKTFAYCYFPGGCNQNLLGILGDFFLALQEVEFVVLVAHNGDVINFSVRNENESWSASRIIQKVLKGRGFGGGHIEMAGGIIKEMSLFSEEAIYRGLISELGL